jgi:polyphosphate glucokinase
MLVDRVRVPTPDDASPRRVVPLIVKLVKTLPAFDRVSVGFPGVVRNGIVVTAPNLGTDTWEGFDVGAALERTLSRPVKVANDADLQGLAVISGRGLEMVWTLGTGFGTGLYTDGRLAPHFEWAHHPFRKRQTYEQQLGRDALDKVGKRRWNRRVLLAIDTLRPCVNFDKLYIGGGNAKHLSSTLPPFVRVVSNTAGILGGIHLWGA